VDDGSYVSTDNVLRLLTSMGFKTRKGRTVTKQTFARMLKNPFYAGWIVSGETRVRGNHEPLVSQELFDRVQVKLNGSTNGKVSHKKVNEDFPLKGFVKCAGCGKNLTAGWSRGKGGQKFAYYWCWNSQCRNKTVTPREKVEFGFFSLTVRSRGQRLTAGAVAVTRCEDMVCPEGDDCGRCSQADSTPQRSEDFEHQVNHGKAERGAYAERFRVDETQH
jgi:hypothetical protein